MAAPRADTVGAGAGSAGTSAAAHATLLGVFDAGGGIGPGHGRAVRAALHAAFQARSAAAPALRGIESTWLAAWRTAGAGDADGAAGSAAAAAAAGAHAGGAAGAHAAGASAAATRGAAAREARGLAGGPRCLLVGRVHDRGDGPAPPDAATLERELARVFGARERAPAVLDGLSGDFVLLLFDAERRRGLLAQDPLGGRSLYYLARGPRLYFASDVAPLLRLLPFRPPPDELVLAHRIAGSAAPPERTEYEGILRLRGGHLLELDHDGCRRRRYWAPEYRRPARIALPELSERLWEATSNAVSRRMRGASRVGIVMSGGLDSTLVAAAATEAMTAAGAGAPQRAGGTPVEALPGAPASLRAYSAVFPGRDELDESERIERLTAHLRLPGVRMEPSAGGILPLMLEYLHAWDVPLAGPGYLIERPLVERAAADGMEVLLDGQGGDEVFSLSPFLLADRIRRGRLLSSLRLARRFPSRSDAPPLRASLILWKRFGLEPALSARFHERRARRRGGAWLDALEPRAATRVEESDSGLDWRRKRPGPLWWAYKAFLLTEGRERVGLPEYLRHRAAMAGLEARPPLLDLGLVRLALSIPPELDFGRFSRPNARGALEGRVPDAVRLDRRKSNMAPFYHGGWIGPELPGLRRVLLDPDARVRRFLRDGALEALLADPPPVGGRGWLSWGPRVWGLLGVECFLRHQEGGDFAERILGAPDIARAGARDVARTGARAVD